MRPIPSQTHSAGGGLNFTFYKSATLDKLLVQGRSTFDTAQAQAAYSAAQRYILQNVITDPLWTPVTQFGVRSNVQGFHTDVTVRFAETDAQGVAHKLAELYTEQDVDRVVVVYNRFVSPLVQRVIVSDLLPIPEHVLEGSDAEDADPEKQALRGDFIYEPEPEEILERLLPVYLETEVYRALLESAASFLAAQMTAMRNASKNANELIDTYTLQMNRARQAEITQEILEVVAGADALS